MIFWQYSASFLGLQVCILKAKECNVTRNNDLPIYKLDTEMSKELAAYTGYFQDLTFACDAFKYLLDHLEKEEQVLLKSLWSAALVSYARCFSHGKRINLTPEIYKNLQGEALECHEYIIGMRNKHIAHSVNPFEEVMVGAIVQNDSVEGIAAIAVSQMFADREGIENLYRLSCVARNFVKSKCKKLQDECLAKTQEADINEIKTGKDLRYVAPGHEDANRAR